MLGSLLGCGRYVCRMVQSKGCQKGIDFHHRHTWQLARQTRARVAALVSSLKKADWVGGGSDRKWKWWALYKMFVSSSWRARVVRFVCIFPSFSQPTPSPSFPLTFSFPWHGNLDDSSRPKKVGEIGRARRSADCSTVFFFFVRPSYYIHVHLSSQSS